MNKTELIAAIAEKAEISKKDSEKALKAFVDVVTEQLKNDDKVQNNEDRGLQSAEVQSGQSVKRRDQLIAVYR